jgi:hypothetical protein
MALFLQVSKRRMDLLSEPYVYETDQICFFCLKHYRSSERHPDKSTLCQWCFHQALNVAKDYFETHDVKVMAFKAQRGNEEYALSFKYASAEHQANQDFTNAQIFIGEGYNPQKLISTKYIELSTGKFSSFWKQAGVTSM